MQASRNKRACACGNIIERIFDSVKNIAENSGAESNAKGRACRINGITGFKSGGFLVDLNNSLVAVDSDNLADKALIADKDHFGHLQVGFSFNRNNRTVY